MININKYKNKSVAQLLKSCVRYCHKYIRLRDEGKGCISCGATITDAGHYFSAGHHSGLKFSEENIHGQCVKCNRFLHGNLINYRRGLVNRYGEDYINALETKEQAFKRISHKWDRFDLIDKIEYYKNKIATFDKDVF